MEGASSVSNIDSELMCWPGCSQGQHTTNRLGAAMAKYSTGMGAAKATYSIGLGAAKATHSTGLGVLRCAAD